jgi:hypothetical protein
VTPAGGALRVSPSPATNAGAPRAPMCAGPLFLAPLSCFIVSKLFTDNSTRVIEREPFILGTCFELQSLKRLFDLLLCYLLHFLRAIQRSVSDSERSTHFPFLPPRK